MLDEVEKEKMALAPRACSMELCQSSVSLPRGSVDMDALGEALGAGTELGTGAEGGTAGAELHTRGRVRM